MFIGVDGTGNSSDFQYQEENRHSLISQLVHTTKGMYFRGPTLVGLSTHQIGKYVANWVMSHRESIPGPLFMAGHSRGGAICILAARHLKHENISIECMLLLDAVDRSGSHAAVIPSNVKFAYHAMRKDEVGSRTSFGHCGTEIDSPGSLVKCPFNATHAAIGGTPWSGVEGKHFKDHVVPAWMTKERDQKATNEVKTWAWMVLRKHGVLP
jgi:hypothetical protein